MPTNVKTRTAFTHQCFSRKGTPPSVLLCGTFRVISAQTERSFPRANTKHLRTGGTLKRREYQAPAAQIHSGQLCINNHPQKYEQTSFSENFFKRRTWKGARRHFWASQVSGHGFTRARGHFSLSGWPFPRTTVLL